MAAGTHAVACTNLAIDSNRTSSLGGSIDDYWTGRNDHYVGDVLLEPNSTLRTQQQIPNDDLYAGRRNSTVEFVVISCYPTTPSNPRPDYVLPDGQRLPHMQRSGEGPLFASQNCPAPAAPSDPACSRWPMIVFSHGLASSPVDGKSIDFLVRLASYGYIVAAPFHGDPRFSRVRLEELSDYWYLLTNFDRFVEMQALRPLAIKATIDLMLSDPQFSGSIDAARIGGVGGSMGGATMIWLLGAKITCSFFSLESRATVQDPRIKAAVGYVPYAGQSFLPAFGNDNATASAVSTPFLSMSGTDDFTAPAKLMEQALNNFRGTRFQVALAGVPHTYQVSYADDVFGWMIPFLDAHVNGNLAALDRLVAQKSVAGGLDDTLRIDDLVPGGVRATELRVDEFFNDLSRHYALFARQADKDFVERGAAGPGWRRTGRQFKGLALPGPAELRPANQSPVCRYYLPSTNTHFYSALQSDCDLVRSIGGLFDGVEFWVTRATEAYCPASTQALTRLYNNRWRELDSNHRYLTSASEIRVMQQQGWSNEGVVMCVPL